MNVLRLGQHGKVKRQQCLMSGAPGNLSEQFYITYTIHPINCEQLPIYLRKSKKNLVPTIQRKLQTAATFYVHSLVLRIKVEA